MGRIVNLRPRALPSTNIPAINWLFNGVFWHNLTSMSQADEQVEVAEQELTPAPRLPATLEPPREIGGRQGPDPTRFGDWELRGRCIDF